MAGMIELMEAGGDDFEFYYSLKYEKYAIWWGIR